MSKIGIIEAGAVNPNLHKKYGSYSDMILKWLKPMCTFTDIARISIYKGDRIPNPNTADIWVISGSRHGEYDNLPWIDPLKKFVITVRKKDIPLIGICFGHQIIAQSLGGKVVKSKKGWGIGVQEYTLQNKPEWLDYSNGKPSLGFNGFYKGFAFHQDQIVKIPQGCEVIAKNDFCPFAMLAYGTIAKPTIITLQSHPEFSSKYFKDLSVLRRNNPIPEKLVDQALVNTECKFYNETLANSLTSILLK